MKKLINLTRHNINLLQLGARHVFPVSGRVARITESSDYILQDGILYKEIKDQRIIGLPSEPNEDEIFIVSRVVAEHIRGNTERNTQDLVFPDDLIIESGIIIGCKSLGRLREGKKSI